MISCLTSTFTINIFTSIANAEKTANNFATQIALLTTIGSCAFVKILPCYDMLVVVVTIIQVGQFWGKIIQALFKDFQVPSQTYSSDVLPHDVKSSWNVSGII